MYLRWLISRLIGLVLGAAVCAELVVRLGTWTGLGVWVAGMAAACGVTALAMWQQAPGKISWINRAAGYVLPWGYRIGRGKLMPIVATSWLIWVLLGVAVMTALNVSGDVLGVGDESRPGGLVMSLLLISWVVDGAVLMRFIAVMATTANPRNMMRSAGPPMLALIGMIVGSIGIVAMNHSPGSARVALALAGGPPLLIGGGYLLFLGVMLTAGKNARWN